MSMDVHIDTKIGMMLVLAFLIGVWRGHEGRERSDQDMMRMDGRYTQEQGEGMRVREQIPDRTVYKMMCSFLMSRCKLLSGGKERPPYSLNVETFKYLV